MKTSTNSGRSNARLCGVSPTSLADALFTTTQQRVLGLLFGQPDRSFFATEIIRLTGSGSGATQRELKRLLSSGLVAVSCTGVRKYYRANPDSPVFEDLRNLIVKTVGVAEPIRRALEPLTDQIELALLYGSVARSTDTAVSDIDILIVAEGISLEDVYFCLSQAEMRLDRRISPALYTQQEFAERKASGNAFLSRVLSGEHLVLIGAEHELPATRKPAADRSAES